MDFTAGKITNLWIDYLCKTYKLDEKVADIYHMGSGFIFVPDC